MGQIRKTTDPSRLTDEQRAALADAAKAQKKVARSKAAHDKNLAERDALIRAALNMGVGVNMIAKTLDINGGMVWKIKRNLKTLDVERMREGGASSDE